MKVAHSVIITPGRCGLYETTRELVSGLRKSGIDSRMFDPTKGENKLYPKGDEDRGAIFCDEDFLLKADVWVNHSGLGRWENKHGKPVIHVAHGRPRHSFLSEKTGSTPIYSYHYNKNKDPDIKAVVTFWPEHIPYHQFMFPDKPVRYVPSCVDLDHWTPGDSGYDFAGKGGSVNIVIADSWRDDVDAYMPMNAVGIFARKRPGVKLHIYGANKNMSMKGWKPILQRLGDDGTMGLLQTWANDLRVVYRAADLIVTGNQIDVRTVREGMSCGCPVLKIPLSLTGINSLFEEALLADREKIRAMAEMKFNPEKTVKAFTEILEDAIR